jgi:hypothetical protein
MPNIFLKTPLQSGERQGERGSDQERQRWRAGLPEATTNEMQDTGHGGAQHARRRST